MFFQFAIYALALVGAAFLIFVTIWMIFDQLEEYKRRKRAKENPDNVESWDHYSLAAAIITSDKIVGDFEVGNFERMQHMKIQHPVTLAVASRDPSSFIALLRDINAAEHNLCGYVFVEATKHNDVEGTRLHFDAKDANSAMLFKLRYGGA